MIKLLKSIVNFLEARFPERLEVTRQEYDNLNRLINEREYDIIRIEENINKLQKSIEALKEGITKGEIKPAKTEAERLREDFINGNFAKFSPISKEINSK